MVAARQPPASRGAKADCNTILSAEKFYSCCNLNPCDSLFQLRYPEISQSRDISASETHSKNSPKPEMEDNVVLILAHFICIA